MIPPSVAQNSYDDSYSLVIVPFGDLAAGDYILDANITGLAFDIRLWDNVGNDLVEGVITPNAQNQISLSFKGPRIGVGLMLATPDTKAEIAWAFRRPSGGNGGGGSGGDGVVTKSLPPVSQSTTNLISYFPSSKTKTVGGQDHGHTSVPPVNSQPGASEPSHPPSQQTPVPSGSGSARPSPSVVLSNDAGIFTSGSSFWQNAVSIVGAVMMVW